MPQFDFATYPAQIFWFILCFIVLYSFIGFVIIPRIREIVGNRKSVISGDLNAIENLNKQVGEVGEKSNAISKDAETKYKDLIAEAATKAKEEREKNFEKFKKDSEELIEKSRVQIDKVVGDCEDKLEGVAVKLSEVIKKRILN